MAHALHHVTVNGRRALNLVSTLHVANNKKQKLALGLSI
jgi:hypothetical protein